jgi:hypothetical protein
MFTTINYLLHEKNKQHLDSDLLQEFNPFFTTRVFSYYDSGKYCEYINDTLNTYSGIFKSKEDEFKFFDAIIPKLKRRKSEYIKKTKADPVKEDIQHIPEFMSKREVDMVNNHCKY